MRSYFLAIIGGFSHSLVIPNEFGQYSAEAYKYAQNGAKLIEIVETGKEPGLFLITSSLNRLAGLSISTSIVFVACIIFILTIISIYEWTKKTANNNIIGIVATVIGISIFLNVTSLILIVTRQALSSLFLLLLSITWIRKNNKIQKKIVLGIFFGAAILSHRIGVLFGLLSIFSILLFYSIKKNRGLVKSTAAILIIGFMLCGPYFFMQIGDTLISIESYLWKLQGGTLDQEITFVKIKEVWEDGGWDFFTSSNAIKHTPLVHYFLFQSFILLPIIASFNLVVSMVRKQTMLILLFIIICVYESFPLIFGTRILITLEMVLVSITSLTLMKKNGRLVKLYIVTGFIILNLLISSKTYLKPQTINIKDDPSIEFIKNNIKKEGSVLLGHPWVADIGNQLGYVTGNNVSYAPLYLPILDTITGVYNANSRPISFSTTRVMTKNMSISLAFRPDTHVLFKGKELYILFIRGMDVKVLKKYNNQHLSSPYLDLIFQDKSGKGYFSYIFKVKKERLVYYEGRAYFHNNLLENYGY